MLELMCQGFIWGCLIGSLTVPSGLVFLDLDPLEGLFPRDPTIFTKCISTILRLIWIYGFVFELTKGVCAYCVLALSVLCAAIRAISRLKEIVRGASLERRIQQKLKVVGVYRQLQLWNQYTNHNFCYRAVPPLVLFGVGILILANYGTIRMRNYFPPVMYPLMPFTAVLASSFIVTVLPIAGSVDDLSRSLLQDMKGRFLKKYERRLVNSLKPLGMQCGSRGMVTKDWTLGIMDSIVDHTITLLITF